jgi:hypothetical protein
MTISRLFPAITLLLVTSVAPACAQQGANINQNAALRYWSAFAEMQDSAITDEQTKELNQTLDGVTPYDDLKYRDLLAQNQRALDTMVRANSLPSCEWGLDYQLGSEAPVDYVRKGLALGRLNVLYAYHLSLTGDKDGAARALAAGLRFSHDLANGGSLFAAVVAKDLIVTHLRVVAFESRTGGLSTRQKMLLQNAVTQLGPAGLDWQSSIRQEFEGHHGPDSKPPVELTPIVPAYLRALDDASLLPRLQKLIASAPQTIQDTVPNPKRVLAEKDDLADWVLKTRSLLQ